MVDAIIGGRKTKILIDLRYLKNFLLLVFAQIAGFTKKKKKESYTLYTFDDKSVRRNKRQMIK
jgi:hypothetical protein